MPPPFLPLRILCEDGALLAVNKPHGLIAQGAPRGVDSLVELVKDYLRQKYQKAGNVYLGVPHRIDRPVSGVMVFSRNSKCAARLSEQFAQRQVQKTYVAVLQGHPPAAEGTLEDHIYRIPDHSRVEIASPDKPDAKPARLSYRVLRQQAGRTLVQVNLETGRMHQIRIQFGSRGCPVAGDEQYGDTRRFPGFQSDDWQTAPIALHAREMTLLHPVRYEPVTITAPVPDLWDRLGIDLSGLRDDGQPSQS